MPFMEIVKVGVHGGGLWHISSWTGIGVETECGISITPANYIESRRVGGPSSKKNPPSKELCSKCFKVRTDNDC